MVEIVSCLNLHGASGIGSLIFTDILHDDSSKLNWEVYRNILFANLQSKMHATLLAGTLR